MSSKCWDKKNRKNRNPNPRNVRYYIIDIDNYTSILNATKVEARSIILLPPIESMINSFFIIDNGFLKNILENNTLIVYKVLNLIQLSLYNYSKMTDLLKPSELQLQHKTYFETGFNFWSQAPTVVTLTEGLYYVPLFVAIELQNSGYYAEALDWLRLVYDYNLPQKERITFIGLRPYQIQPITKAPFTIFETLIRQKDWMRDNVTSYNFAFNRKCAHLHFTLSVLVRCLIDYADAEFTKDTEPSRARAQVLYNTVLELFETDDFKSIKKELYVPLLNKTYTFEGTIMDSLKTYAEISLRKLRQGRTLAGLLRTQGLNNRKGTNEIIRNFKPTIYRYKTLIERARYITGLAQQIEASMLSSLEKMVDAAYNRLRAQQEINLLGAQDQLQRLRVEEARMGVDLADIQYQKTTAQQKYYENMTAPGESEMEKKQLEHMFNAVERSAKGTGAGLFTSAVNFLANSATGDVMGALNIIVNGTRQYELDLSNIESQASQYWSIKASYERQKQEWEQQKVNSQYDVTTANQQKVIASKHVSIVEQERNITSLQQSQAETVLNFLQSKFLNMEMYDWMLRVMYDVYRYFLQQATSLALTAQQQLAFERQQEVPAFILTDYYAPPKSNNNSDDEKDRKGLTGAERILKDITQLDQFAFDTDKRKLQISRTISLSQLAPYEFMKFRETGSLYFTTPMSLFDRDFPGQYLRLIKRVKVTVAALLPPAHGIKATLSSSGLSRVVINENGGFQTVRVRRDPEMIALSSPYNQTGLFEMDSQAEMLMPFESTGVETTWQFSLPRPANAFDFSSIADVFLTIDYTSLHDYNYETDVIKSLGKTVDGERVFSLRNEFPDAWYKFNNPETEIAEAEWELSMSDFPPNISGVTISHVGLYIVGDNKPEMASVKLLFENVHGETLDGLAILNDTLVSTRSGNASGWIGLIGKNPLGKWKLVLEDNNGQAVFNEQKWEDIWFCMSYEGERVAWPGEVLLKF